MDLRLLNYFAILCEEMNYGRAAKRLFISQPTLSQQIKMLEQSLGLILIQKVGNKFELTPEGELLKIQAYKFLTLSQETDILLEQTKKKEQKKVTIYSSGCHFFTDILVNYSQCYPNVSIKIDEGSSTNVVNYILDKKADLGLVYSALLKENPPLVMEELFEDKFFIFVNKEHHLAQYDSLSLRALEQEKLILVKPLLAVREIIGDVASQHNILLQPTYEFPNYLPCLDLTRKNLGVTILPWSFAKFHSLDKLKRIAINESVPSVTLAFLHRKETVFMPHQLEFIKQIKATYED